MSWSRDVLRHRRHSSGALAPSNLKSRFWMVLGGRSCRDLESWNFPLLADGGAGTWNLDLGMSTANATTPATTLSQRLRTGTYGTCQKTASTTRRMHRHGHVSRPIILISTHVLIRHN